MTRLLRTAKDEAAKAKEVVAETPVEPTPPPAPKKVEKPATTKKGMFSRKKK